MNNKIRKIFEVYIERKTYPVYDIEGKEHEGLNDSPKSWWLYFADALPETLLPPIDSDSLVPFCSKSIKRHVWELKFIEGNTSKMKWSSWQFSHKCRCEIWCNGKKVNEFLVRDMDFAIAKAQVMMVEMGEHPYDFFNPEKEKDRKIYFYGLPATIQPKQDPWEIMVYPEYNDELNKEGWWKEYYKRSNPEKDELSKEYDDEDKSMECINWGEALSDQHIKWFRK